MRAWCTIGPVAADNPSAPSEKIMNRACVPRDFYDAYFKGKTLAYGLSVSNVQELRTAITLDRLRREVGLSQPPESLIRLAHEM